MQLRQSRRQASYLGWLNTLMPRRCHGERFHTAGLPGSLLDTLIPHCGRFLVYVRSWSGFLLDEMNRIARRILTVLRQERLELLRPKTSASTLSHKSLLIAWWRDSLVPRYRPARRDTDRLLHQRRLASPTSLEESRSEALASRTPSRLVDRSAFTVPTTPTTGTIDTDDVTAKLIRYLRQHNYDYRKDDIDPFPELTAIIALQVLHPSEQKAHCVLHPSRLAQKFRSYEDLCLWYAPAVHPQVKSLARAVRARLKTLHAIHSQRWYGAWNPYASGGWLEHTIARLCHHTLQTLGHEPHTYTIKSRVLLSPWGSSEIIMEVDVLVWCHDCLFFIEAKTGRYQIQRYAHRAALLGVPRKRMWIVYEKKHSPQHTRAHSGQRVCGLRDFIDQFRREVCRTCPPVREDSRRNGF
ncbi:MAG: hypothetical protein KatS3mg114_0678 [Planctomycetaceae bacterium]|nr:MAG: hypothetical protein KatS3mg114_0678 [Planctomycetaceae bacterium]